MYAKSLTKPWPIKKASPQKIATLRGLRDSVDRRRRHPGQSRKTRLTYNPTSCAFWALGVPDPQASTSAPPHHLGWNGHQITDDVQ